MTLPKTFEKKKPQSSKKKNLKKEDPKSSTELSSQSGHRHLTPSGGLIGGYSEAPTPAQCYGRARGARDGVGSTMDGHASLGSGIAQGAGKGGARTRLLSVYWAVPNRLAQSRFGVSPEVFLGPAARLPTRPTTCCWNTCCYARLYV